MCPGTLPVTARRQPAPATTSDRTNLRAPVLVRGQEADAEGGAAVDVGAAVGGDHHEPRPGREVDGVRARQLRIALQADLEVDGAEGEARALAHGEARAGGAAVAVAREREQ